MGLFIIYLINLTNNLKRDNYRQANNVIALAKNSSIQQELTKSEYKEFYAAKEDSLLKALKIKQNKVTNIVKVVYNYKDTTITHIKLDTIKIKITGTESFIIPKDCFTIKGKIDKTGITINSVENNDKLTYILYKSYHKKFLFFHWKPYYESKIYSECKKDTMSIQTNLKIQE